MKLPQRLSRQTIYTSSWVNLHVDRVAFPGGRIVEQYHIVEVAHDGVGVLAVNEAGEILLVKAYRYTTESLNWEIPAGLQEDGETVIQTAEREALEETGWKTSEHRLIYSFHPINGISNHTFHIVTCHAVSGSDSWDQDEVERVRWFSKAELKELIKQHEINDGLTLVSLLIFLNDDLSL